LKSTMANWIKMRIDLADDPAVIAMAARLNLDEDMIVGKLHRLWSWFDQHTMNGNAIGVTATWVDRRVNCQGFSEAMISVGWLDETADGLQLPNFERHNGETAKARALTANRVAKSKTKGNATTVTTGNALSVTTPLPRLDKRREYKEHTPPAGETGQAAPPDLGPRETWLPGESPAFKKFFAAYPRKSAPSKAWTVWQATVAGLVGQRGKPDAEVEDWLIDRAEAYASSPAGMPPPPGQDDFRPAPAKWLQDGKYDEPFEEWQKPNAKAKHGTDGNSNSRSYRRAATPASEAVRPTEDLDAWFDQAVSGKPSSTSAGGVAKEPTEGLSATG
jgi:hypothetical protein